ncbi:dephospho-CoA kinase [Kaarinaea lacus]
MTLTIGLTGGIGSGKSTVAKLFADLGVPVYDTDTIARELVQPGKPALKEMIEALGSDIISGNGELDRQALKQRIFDNDDVRKRVEEILHPKIRKQLLSNIESCSAPYCIAVIPLLIEKNWLNIVDRVLVVDVPQEMQLERATARDSVSKNLILQIIKTQVSRDTRLAVANETIDNSGDPQQLANLVDELHKKYMALTSND